MSPRATLVEINSAPLRCGVWGSGIFFLHDGRTSNLLSANRGSPEQRIRSHLVEEAFDLLSPSQQQDLLNFLRSL